MIDAYAGGKNWAIDVLVKVIVAILGVFFEGRMLFHIIMFFIFMDQIVGVTRAVALGEFDWKSFKKVYIKIIVYLSVIMSTFVYEKYLMQNASLFFTKAVTALVAFRELTSIYNNASKALKSKMFKKLINKFRN